MTASFAVLAQPRTMAAMPMRMALILTNDALRKLGVTRFISLARESPVGPLATLSELSESNDQPIHKSGLLRKPNGRQRSPGAPAAHSITLPRPSLGERRFQRGSGGGKWLLSIARLVATADRAS